MREWSPVLVILVLLLTLLTVLKTTMSNSMEPQTVDSNPEEEGFTGTDPPQISKEELMRRKFRENYDRVKRFHCRANGPKPSAVKVRGLPTEYDITNSMILQPDSTVLDRCGTGSGCCLDASLECIATNRTAVEVVVLATDLHTRLKQLVSFSAYNDTSCDCDVVSDSPR